DGHPALRVLEAGVAQRRPDAVGGFTHGAVRKTDGGGVRQARGDVDLDVDDDRLDAAKCAGADAREHGLAGAGPGEPRQSLGAEYRACAVRLVADDSPGLAPLQSIRAIARLLEREGSRDRL